MMTASVACRQIEVPSSRLPNKHQDVFITCSQFTPIPLAEYKNHEPALHVLTPPNLAHSPHKGTAFGHLYSGSQSRLRSPRPSNPTSPAADSSPHRAAANPGGLTRLVSRHIVDDVANPLFAQTIQLSEFG